MSTTSNEQPIPTPRNLAPDKPNLHVSRIKEWTCLLLFRILFPVVFLTACVVRFNAFSLGYGCLAICSSLVKRPSSTTIYGSTGYFLLGVVVYSGLALFSQMTFQIYLMVSKTSETLFLNCLPLELILRQIGLQKINDTDLGNALRLVLPDALASVCSLFIFLVCRCSLQPAPQSSISTLIGQLQTSSSVSSTNQTRFYKSGSLLIEYLGSSVVLLLMIMCGIAEPNVLSVTYFVCFLLATTLWACGIKFGRWFIAMEICLLIYCGLHLVAIYLSQFPSIQSLWFERDGWNDTNFVHVENVTNSTGVLYRLLGLKTFVYTNCSHPYILHFNVNLKWTDILQVVAMVTFFLGTGIEMRSRISKFRTSAGLSHTAPQTPNGLDNPSFQFEDRNLVSGTQQHPYYQSLDNVANDSNQSASPTDERSNFRFRRRTEPSNKRFEIFKTISLYIANFILSQSYNGALIVMMAWSITYHSWATFLFLVAACLIWMVPQKRDLVFKTSPVFVCYAIILLSLTYIYGLDLTSSELPSPTEGKGYSMTKIGLIRRNKYQEPFLDLAIQCFFTLIFILTLRQSRWESSSNEADVENLRNEFNLSRKMSVIQSKTKASRLMKQLGHLINSILVKYWIIVCSLLFLVMALQESVLYRIIYMILFLYFVITFQVSYQFWRIWVRVFWVIVIFYSMVVLLSIYVVQFDEVMNKLKEMNARSPKILEDIGLRKYSTAELFVSLLTPTSFLIVVILHIHYFQSQFLVISDVNRYSNSSNVEIIRMDDDDDEGGSDDEDLFVNATGTFETSMRRIYLYGKRTYHSLANLLWRVLEVHVSKAVVVFIIVVCAFDVCALNVLLLLFTLILYPLNFHHTLSIITMFYTSFIIITRMVYQLSIFEEKAFTTECLFKQADYDVMLHNGTVSAAAYFGYKKTGNIFYEVKIYVYLVILLAFEMVVSIRQKQHFNHPRYQRPKKGTIFLGVNRSNADVSVTSWLKFYANYGFYKFGKEESTLQEKRHPTKIYVQNACHAQVCFIFVVVVMTTRLDAFSLIHGFLMGWMVFLRRWACRRVWPAYLFLLVVVVFLQYLSCLGLPKSLCIDYPWNLDNYSKIFTTNLKVFLFLPDYVLPPYAIKIIADFTLFMLVCLQRNAFTKERALNLTLNSNPDEEGGSNNSMVFTVLNLDTVNPTKDFILYKDSYLDYVKVGVFYYSFWVTLLVLFIAGTFRVNLLCLGYLIGCFFFLWHGQDLLLKPLRVIKKVWLVMLFYCLFALMVKCSLQAVGCIYYGKLNSKLINLLHITCIPVPNYDVPPNENNSTIDADRVGFAWDALGFSLILVLLRVHKSWYFQHVVNELHVDSVLASRGSELIKEMTQRRIESQKRYESSLLDKIRLKVERIRDSMLRKQEATDQPIVHYTDHYEVIRSGDYYMFDDLDTGPSGSSSSSNEVKDDDVIYNEAHKKLPRPPTVAELFNIVSISNMETAIKHWKDWMRNNRLKETNGGGVGGEGSKNGGRDDGGEMGGKRDEGVEDEEGGEELQEGTSDGRVVAKPQKPPPSPSVEKKEENLLSIIKDMTGAKNLVPADEDTTVKKKRTIAQTIRISFYFSYIIVWAGAEQLILFLNSLAQDYIFISDILYEEKQKIKKATILYRSHMLADKDYLAEREPEEQLQQQQQQQQQLTPATSPTDDDIDDSAVLTERDSRQTEPEPQQPKQPKIFDPFTEIKKIAQLLQLSPSLSSQDLASSAEKRPYQPQQPPPTTPHSQRYHLPLPLLIFNSCYTVFLSNSELLCYFAMVLNAMVYGSILSIVYPITAFLWAMMTCPRPSKRFWLFAIGYTEICIVIKYIYQFVTSHPESTDNVPVKENIFQWPYTLGLVNMAGFDIFLLFCLFFHRSVLMQHGLWDEAVSYKRQLKPKNGSGGEDDENGVKTLTSPSKSVKNPLPIMSSPTSPSRTVDPNPDTDPDTLQSSLPMSDNQPDSLLRKRNVKKRTKNENESKNRVEDEASDAGVKKKSDDIKLKTLKSIKFDVDEAGNDVTGDERGSYYGDDQGGDDDYDERVGKDGKEETLKDEFFKLCCENSLVRPMYEFYHYLRDQSFRAATDVYVFVFLTDLVTFLIAVFGFSSFGPTDASANNDGKVTTVLKNNKIPSALLGMLLVQFIFIIIDRALYLRKQVLLKFIFQIFLVILIHIWMFFGLPEITQRRFINNVAAQIWYFVKCVYFVLSAYQIRSGYPTCVLGNFLTKKYNYFNLFSFQAFLAIPYLLELRALMDWMFTDTTLSLSSWLQMEDIYANIFCVKCNRSAEKRYKTPRGNKRAALIKYGLGGIILVALVVIIWFPLLLFSMSNAIFLPSQPVEVYVDVTIAGYEELFKMTSQNVNVFTQSDYDYFYMKNSFFMTQYQTLDIYNATVKGESGSIWGITPPALNDLVQQLQAKDSVTLTFNLQVRRDPGVGGETTKGQFKRELGKNGTDDVKIRDTLVNMLKGLSNESVTIMNAFPRLLLVPAKGVISSAERSFVRGGVNATEQDQTGHLRLTLHTPSNFTYWWSVYQYFNSSDDEYFLEDPGGSRAAKPPAYTNKPFMSTTFRPFMRTIRRTQAMNATTATTTPVPKIDTVSVNTATDPGFSISRDRLMLTMFNDRVAPSGVLSIINNYGVIGLYVSLVLVIGRFLRMYIQGLSFKIMFVELPDPQVLLTLCQDIYMVRESKEFRLEEELFSQLIFLYRSPETLIKVTKQRIN